MARQHDIIINRLLANYLIRAMDDVELQIGISDIAKASGVMGICKAETDEIIKAGKKRLKQLELISQPLSEPMRNWMDELRKA
jgi:hypothetical protein